MADPEWHWADQIVLNFNRHPPSSELTLVNLVGTDSLYKWNEVRESGRTRLIGTLFKVQFIEFVFIFWRGVYRVFVDDGWFKQPHQTWERLIDSGAGWGSTPVVIWAIKAHRKSQPLPDTQEDRSGMSAFNSCSACNKHSISNKPLSYYIFLCLCVWEARVGGQLEQYPKRYVHQIKQKQNY